MFRLFIGVHFFMSMIDFKLLFFSLTEWYKGSLQQSFIKGGFSVILYIRARLQIKCALKRGTLRGKFLITCLAKNYVMSACDVF